MTHVNELTAPTVKHVDQLGDHRLEITFASGLKRKVSLLGGKYKNIILLGYGWYYVTEYWQGGLPHIEVPFRMTTEGKKE